MPQVEVKEVAEDKITTLDAIEGLEVTRRYICKLIL
jgi:hypothetical protein